MSLLPEHSHCQYCDDPVEEGQEYCSEECRQKFEGEARKERNRNMLFLGLVAIAIITMSIITLG